MTQADHRFGNVLGEEYDLLKLAYPHYDRLQKEIGNVISDHFKGSDQKAISALEIGCGTGITTKFLLECDSRLHIVAVDNEKKMLDQIKVNIDRWNAASRIDLVESEVSAYLKSTPDASFDVVASGFVVHNFEQKFRDSVIAEIFRVLKPGGLFVNGDKYAHNDPQIRAKIYKEQIERYNVYDGIGRSDYKKEWVEHMDRDEKDDLYSLKERQRPI